MSGPTALPDIDLPASLRDRSAHPVLAAPLAGWTDLPYRKILRLCGAKHMWIPFVSAHALTSGSPDRDPYLAEISRDPCHVQIFGADPARCAEAARIIEQAGALSIDFNCGCSVKKVHKGGGGSALLRDLRLLARNLEAIVGAVKIPVSMKTRIGFHKSDDDSGLEACRMAEKIGCAWVTLHGRTARQGFDGPANWEPIAQLASELTIPVVGNGDVSSPADAEKMFRQTGCAGVMIGRAIMGDPWLVADCEKYLTDGTARPRRTRAEIADVMLTHQSELLAHYGPRKGMLEFRKHIVRYLRGFAQASILRRALVTIEDPEKIRRMLEEFGSGTPPSAIDAPDY